MRQNHHALWPGYTRTHGALHPKRSGKVSEPDKEAVQ